MCCLLYFVCVRDSANSHGTRCAGEIAMVANNHLCGVSSSASKSSILRFVIMEKAPTRAFS